MITKDLQLDDLEQLAIDTLAEHGINHVWFFVDDTQGRYSARYSDTRLRIPAKFAEYCENWNITQILHECSHFINWHKNSITGHGKKFKQIYARLLKEYGIKAIYEHGNCSYAKAYITDDGDSFWSI